MYFLKAFVDVCRLEGDSKSHKTLKPSGFGKLVFFYLGSYLYVMFDQNIGKESQFGYNVVVHTLLESPDVQLLMPFRGIVNL